MQLVEIVLYFKSGENEMWHPVGEHFAYSILCMYIGR